MTENSVASLETEYNKAIHDCNILMLYRKFTECLELCHYTIEDARNYSEKSWAVKAVESLCILAIQSYAELNRWQEVLPYITQVYNGIEDCPEKVVQLCILLHAQMKDYTTCNAVAHIWLRNPNNFTKSRYPVLVETFLLRVLLPQRRWQDIPPFLEACPGLTAENRNCFLEFTEKIKQEEIKEMERKKREDSTDTQKDPSAQVKKDTKLSKKNAHGQQDGPMMHFVRKMVSYLSRIIPPVSVDIIKNMAVFSILLYLIITRPTFDFISNERLLGIFATMKRLWMAMFAPFHLARESR